jgi:hypothetical protein
MNSVISAIESGAPIARLAIRRGSWPVIPNLKGLRQTTVKTDKPLLTLKFVLKFVLGQGGASTSLIACRGLNNVLQSSRA